METSSKQMRLLLVVLLEITYLYFVMAGREGKVNSGGSFTGRRNAFIVPSPPIRSSISLASRSVLPVFPEKRIIGRCPSSSSLPLRMTFNDENNFANYEEINSSSDDDSQLGTTREDSVARRISNLTEEIAAGSLAHIMDSTARNPLTQEATAIPASATTNSSSRLEEDSGTAAVNAGHATGPPTTSFKGFGSTTAASKAGGTNKKKMKNKVSGLAEAKNLDNDNNNPPKLEKADKTPAEPAISGDFANDKLPLPLKSTTKQESTPGGPAIVSASAGGNDAAKAEKSVVKEKTDNSSVAAKNPAVVESVVVDKEKTGMDSLTDKVVKPTVRGDEDTAGENDGVLEKVKVDEKITSGKTALNETTDFRRVSGFSARKSSNFKDNDTKSDTETTFTIAETESTTEDCNKSKNNDTRSNMEDDGSTLQKDNLSTGSDTTTGMAITTVEDVASTLQREKISRTKEDKWTEEVVSTLQKGEVMDENNSSHFGEQLPVNESTNETKVAPVVSASAYKASAGTSVDDSNDRENRGIKDAQPLSENKSTTDSSLPPIGASKNESTIEQSKSGSKVQSETVAIPELERKFGTASADNNDRKEDGEKDIQSLSEKESGNATFSQQPQEYSTARNTTAAKSLELTKSTSTDGFSRLQGIKFPDLPKIDIQLPKIEINQKDVDQALDVAKLGVLNVLNISSLIAEGTYEFVSETFSNLDTTMVASLDITYSEAFEEITRAAQGVAKLGLVLGIAVKDGMACLATEAKKNLKAIAERPVTPVSETPTFNPGFPDEEDDNTESGDEEDITAANLKYLDDIKTQAGSMLGDLITSTSSAAEKKLATLHDKLQGLRLSEENPSPPVPASQERPSGLPYFLDLRNEEDA